MVADVEVEVDIPAKDAIEYAKSRRASSRACSRSAASTGDAAPRAPRPNEAKEPAAQSMVPPADSTGIDIDEDGDLDEMMEGLEENEATGTAATAIDVWLTSILHQADVNAHIEDHYDLEQVRALT